MILLFYMPHTIQPYTAENAIIVFDQQAWHDILMNSAN